MHRRSLTPMLPLSTLALAVPFAAAHHGIVYEEEFNNNCNDADANENYAFDDHTHAGDLDDTLEPDVYDTIDIWVIPSVAAGMRVSASLHFNPAGKDYDLYLASGTCYAFVDWENLDSGGARYVSYDTSRSGPLYIHVDDDAGRGAYQVELSIRPVPPTDPCDEHPWSLMPHSVCQLLHP